MPQTRINFTHIFGLITVVFILFGFQSTFWFQVFGTISTPLIWLNVVLYLGLYRKTLEAYITCYALGLIFCAFSVTPLGIYWLEVFVLVSLILFFRTRIFWPGPRYFFLASLATTVTYQILTTLITHFIEQSDVSIHFGARIIEIIMTGLSSLPVFYLMSSLDRWTHKENLPESGGLEA